MNTNLLDIKFARIGARLKVADRPTRRNRTSGVISLDVQADRKGEFFEIVRQAGAEVAVLDVQPADRHLLLLVREGKDKSKFYVRGRVRHADYATITLHRWHRVMMNTEGQSKAMRNVAFLD
jgi:hypothetical protein